ncbi:MAG: LON peptidase substrate-binding domain-containing protein [Alphaproteobacteria bacterium]|nr:LON peptidase substrate-binding domain-containing protein [Alphaproteobacteria bacterium]
MGAFGYRKVQDLPRSFPVFPLTGAILFPRGGLPLNIFEPRYLNMIDDAIASERIIGMIQPSPRTVDQQKPPLSAVGCAGRITSFAETDDGRYLITLTGMARFRVVRELDIALPYRKVEAEFGEFADDLQAPGAAYAIDRTRLTKALRRYVEVNGYQVDWSAVDDAAPEVLVNAVATLCPFEPAEKQALLETVRLDERCAALVTLLELNTGSGDRPVQ